MPGSEAESIEDPEAVSRPLGGDLVAGKIRHPARLPEEDHEARLEAPIVVADGALHLGGVEFREAEALSGEALAVDVGHRAAGGDEQEVELAGENLEPPEAVAADVFTGKMVALREETVAARLMGEERLEILALFAAGFPDVVQQDPLTGDQGLSGRIPRRSASFGLVARR